MIIVTKSFEYACARAEYHKDEVHLLDENGNLKCVLIKPEIKEVIDGEIVTIVSAEPCTDDVLNTLLGVTK